MDVNSIIFIKLSTIICTVQIKYRRRSYRQLLVVKNSVKGSVRLMTTLHMTVMTSDSIISLICYDVIVIFELQR